MMLIAFVERTSLRAYTDMTVDVMMVQPIQRIFDFSRDADPPNARTLASLHLTSPCLGTATKTRSALDGLASSSRGEDAGAGAWLRVRLDDAAMGRLFASIGIKYTQIHSLYALQDRLLGVLALPRAVPRRFRGRLDAPHRVPIRPPRGGLDVLRYDALRPTSLILPLPRTQPYLLREQEGDTSVRRALTTG
ncbi:hypothetical protein BD310DRAFT_539506 [Dichomitus squalens]|uniref:Uncharacterized protein n=1 Tax=Dichomitus squalens TaxID=114155 RepID=A0A4Q9PT55_9APHY|nr:hypothetical protein BD310DRAFT_539506 [Dichomitus squalens]